MEKILGILVAVLTTNTVSVDLRPVPCDICYKPHAYEVVVVRQVKRQEEVNVLRDGRPESLLVDDPVLFPPYTNVHRIMLENAHEHEGTGPVASGIGAEEQRSRGAEGTPQLAISNQQSPVSNPPPILPPALPMTPAARLEAQPFLDGPQGSVPGGEIEIAPALPRPLEGPDIPALDRAALAQTQPPPPTDVQGFPPMPPKVPPGFRSIPTRAARAAALQGKSEKEKGVASLQGKSEKEKGPHLSASARHQALSPSGEGEDGRAPQQLAISNQQSPVSNQPMPPALGPTHTVEVSGDVKIVVESSGKFDKEAIVNWLQQAIEVMKR